jgi:hypothetical protein
MAAAVPREMLRQGGAASGVRSAPTTVEPVVSSPGAPPKIDAAAAALAAVGEEDYWTEERMKGAIPREMGRVEPGQEAAAAPAPSPEASVEPMGYAYPYPFTRYNVFRAFYYQTTPGYPPMSIFPFKTVGKLFFTLGATDYVCSASVIRPHLLLTARHCVFDYDSGLWATNTVFYPAYVPYVWPVPPYPCNKGNYLLGCAWNARLLATWVSGSPGYQYDIGFIQLYDHSGTPGSCNAYPSIDDYTGYLGWSYGGGYSSIHWDEFGYPQASPFTGNYMVESESSTGALDVFGELNTVEVGNDMTGGSSGGPWIKNLSAGSTSSFNNYANGLNSYRWIVPDHSLAMNGPQFLQNNFGSLYNFVMSIPCP